MRGERKLLQPNRQRNANHACVQISTAPVSRIRDPQAAQTHRADVDFTRHIVVFGRRGKTRDALSVRCPISATRRATISCRKGDLGRMSRLPVKISCRVSFLCKVLSNYLKFNGLTRIFFFLTLKKILLINYSISFSSSQ